MTRRTILIAATAAGAALLILASLRWLESDPVDTPGPAAVIGPEAAVAHHDAAAPPLPVTADEQPVALPAPSKTRWSRKRSKPAHPPAVIRNLVLRGRVVDSRGQSVSGARVIYSPSEQYRDQTDQHTTPVIQLLTRRSLPEATTGADGSFRLACKETEAANGRRVSSPRQMRPDEISEVHVAHAGFVMAATPVPTDAWDVAMGDIVLRDAAGLTARIVDESGAPLQGIRAACPDWSFLREDSSGHERLSLDEAAAMKLTIDRAGPTGHDGEFHVESLHPIRYRIAFSGAGRQEQVVECQLEEGKTLALGDIVMPVGSVLAGRLVNDLGRPLNKASIVLTPTKRTVLRLAPSPPTRGDSTGRLVAQEGAVSDYRSVTTKPHGPSDWDGGFRFDELHPVPHDLSVRAGWGRETLVRSLRPDLDELEIVLPRQSVYVLRLVADVTGQPVSRFAAQFDPLQAFANEAALLGDTTPAVLFGSRAAKRLGMGGPSDGLVIASPRGEAKHRVSITCDDYAPFVLDLPGLSPGTTHEQTIRLRSKSSVSGRVMDSAGHAVKGVTVEVEPLGRLQSKGTPDLTDTDGVFTLNDLSPGDWLISASATDWLPPAERVITIHPGRVLEGIDLRLPSGASISGIVLDGAGVPVACNVRLYYQDISDRRLGTQSDDTGAFRFRFVRPGRVVLVARTDASRTPAVEHTLYDGGEQVTQLQFGGGRLVGRVLVAETNAPAADVYLRARWMDESADLPSELLPLTSPCWTDASGRFELPLLAPGRHVLTPSMVGHIPANEEPLVVTIGRGTQTIDLFVTEAAVLRGRVITRGAEAMDSYSLTLRRIARPGSHATIATVDVEYILAGIRPGTYTYEVRRNLLHSSPIDMGPVFDRGQVTLIGGETTVRDLVLSPGDG